MRLFVILACHNRQALTLRCIELARAAAEYANAEISFTVFDDGSTDGTSEALSALPIPIRIIKGDGSAYWASGMAQAEAAVLSEFEFGSIDNGYIVWLNDDVALDRNSFALLRQSVTPSKRAVLVGAMRDPKSGEITYSGMRRTGLHPLKFEMVPPAETLQTVQAFNGNLVLVPMDVAVELGGIDGGFSHALADIDYGLRCGRAGVPVILAPSTYGTCKRNETPTRGRARDDWRAFVGPKGGGNFHSLRRILRKGFAVSWPLVIAATYLLWWVRRAIPVAAYRRASL